MSLASLTLKSGQDSTSTGRMPMRAIRTRSDFDASQLQFYSIQKREILSYSVHHSLATMKWIATIPRPSSDYSASANEVSVRSFPFDSEREARKFAKSYSPPKMKSNTKECGNCSALFTPKCAAYNCRNCGVEICNSCSTRWSSQMIPKTYVVSSSSVTVRVCGSCNWLSNAFCKALLQGNYESAVKLYETGNVNLRCTFADIKKEAMFPVHCAVMGGNLKLLTWLADVHSCPLAVRRDKGGKLLSLQTSKSRTLMDLAMTGKPKIDIMSYLVKKKISINDTRDKMLAAKTLEFFLEERMSFDKRDEENIATVSVLGDDISVATTHLEDACVICCETQMDCVLSPCGHQVCCSGCGSKLTCCPICKQACNVLRVYRL